MAPPTALIGIVVQVSANESDPGRCRYSCAVTLARTRGRSQRSFAAPSPAVATRLAGASGTPSSSTISSVTASGATTHAVAGARLADTVTCLSAASRLSSAAVIVTIPVLPPERGAKLRVRFALSVKSVAAAGATAAAATSSVKAVAEVGLTLAVTVLTPLFSLIGRGVSFSVTRGCSRSWSTSCSW